MRYTILLLALLTGCTHYEYDLIKPADNRLHVGTKTSATTTIEPLRYELITVESKLVMMIHNPTDQPITLSPAKSYVLDPNGRSRNVQGITIAPGGYAKFIFPPPKPYVRDDSGVHFGVGTSIETAGGFHHGRGLGTGVGYETGGPRTVQNLDENYYWDWDGGTAVTFHFVFSDGDKTFTQDLTLQRVKM